PPRRPDPENSMKWARPGGPRSIIRAGAADRSNRDTPGEREPCGTGPDQSPHTPRTGTSVPVDGDEPAVPGSGGIDGYAERAALRRDLAKRAAERPKRPVSASESWTRQPLGKGLQPRRIAEIAEMVAGDGAHL